MSAADAVDRRVGPPGVVVGLEEDVGARGRGAVEGGVEEVEGDVGGEFGAEGGCCLVLCWLACGSWGLEMRNQGTVQQTDLSGT